MKPSTERKLDRAAREAERAARRASRPARSTSHEGMTASTACYTLAGELCNAARIGDADVLGAAFLTAWLEHVEGKRG